MSISPLITDIIRYPFAIIFPMMFCRRLPNRSFVSLLWSEKYDFFGAPPHDEGVFEKIVFLSPEKRYKAPTWHTSTKHHRKDDGKRITNNICYRMSYRLMKRLIVMGKTFVLWCCHVYRAHNQRIDARILFLCSWR